MSEQVKKYKKYKKPPIVEAVIEVRFVKPLEERQIEKLVSKMKSEFTIQRIEEVGLRVSVEEISGLQAEAKTRLAGYKLVNNADSAIIVQIKQDAISISRLPPYEGWPNLLAEFKKYYDWYTNKNFKTLSRIGVRYINRIDIPWMDGNIKLEHYFKIYPHTPKKNFPALISFSVQSIAAIDNDRVLTINVHESDNSPLLNHGSFVFDLDVAQSKNLPANNTQLFAMLDEMRDKKNFFFEDLLTPKCKRLFN